MPQLDELIFDVDRIIGLTVTRFELGLWILFALMTVMSMHLKTMGNKRSAFESLRGPSYSQNINDGQLIDYPEEES